MSAVIMGGSAQTLQNQAEHLYENCRDVEGNLHGMSPNSTPIPSAAQTLPTQDTLGVLQTF